MEESKELETLRQRGELSTQREVPGLESFPNSAIQIPRLIIGQPDNKSNMPAGVFVNNLTNETYNDLNVVLLKFNRSRTLWPPGDPQPNDQPVCRSTNAILSDKEFMGRLCPRCDDEHDTCVDEKDNAICRHAKFTKEGPPQCRLNYHLLLITVETADVFILTLSGKGISPTNKLISGFKVKGRPPYSAKFNVSLINKGRYYMIQYTSFKWLETPEELQKIFNQFKDTPIVPTREEAE